jgi:DNA-directed RNA polymerase subunit RPC12/RpoP
MTFRPKLLDELLTDYKSTEDLPGQEGLLKQLTAALVERCLNAEMGHHLEEERQEPEAEPSKPRNRLNGRIKKTGSPPDCHLPKSTMSMLTCPNCNAQTVVKNGHIHNGKQNYKCTTCGRQFVENPQQKRIDQNTRDLVDKPLLEKIPLIARVCDVRESWLQDYVNRKYQAIPRQVDVS